MMESVSNVWRRRPAGSLPRFCGVLLALAMFAIAFLPKAAQAGGGPENVFLVVNSASWASQAVANQFIALRKIPACNVYYIDWDEGTEGVQAEVFRQKILGLVLININNRKLADQIDYIIYSSDFPYLIDLTTDLQGKKPPAHQSPNASLSGATYLWQLVMARNPAAINLQCNQYMRSSGNRKTVLATHGFRSWYGWNPDGNLIDSGGQHFMLSTVLGVTSGRGNSVDEVISYLDRATKADGSKPKGTVYFMKNSDVRTKTRAGGFDQAARELERLGVAADILSGNLPMQKPDVIGAMIGVADFSWPSSGSTILPGAICEHLTSFGGIMNEGAGQTPLTELLRYGAAGSSGTVAEPMAIQDKFPAPAIHVHYAQGCSLAESYYQSLYGPYQILIVGDPLCQPWADIPKVTVEKLKAGAKLSGQLELKATATYTTNTEVDHFELFIDGRRAATAWPDETLSFDSRKEADGYHELRIVAIGAKPIETQGRLIVPVEFDNLHRRVTVKGPQEKNLQWDEPLKLSATAEGLGGVVFFHNGRVIGKFAGTTGEVEINPRLLGTGPVTIEALGIGRSGPDDRVAAAPLHYEVQAGTPLPAVESPPQGELKSGLQLTRGSGGNMVIETTRDPAWLGKAGVKPGDAFELSGYFRLDRQLVQQFLVSHDGPLTVKVDSTVLYMSDEGGRGIKYLPVALAPGLHRVVLSGKAGPHSQLRALYGGPGALSLGNKVFAYVGK